LVAAKLRETWGHKTSLLSLAPLAGDASSRRYYRAFIAGERVPDSLIVMQLAGSQLPISSEELAVFTQPLAELPFLNVYRFLHRLGVSVPALYGQWPDDGILLLEDLGDASLWDSVQGLSFSAVLRYYEMAIDQLLRIQILGTRARNDSCMAFQQRFDFRLYMWEFEHFLDYGFAGEKITAGERSLLTQSFYHSWNLMVRGGKIVVIDFQDALLAPLQYDLASLLNDRETDRVIGPDAERRLLEYYLRRKDALAGTRTDRDEFYETYLLSALQRDFKVVGRFRFLDQVKGKPGYKQYIPATLRRIKRNLQRTGRFASLVAVLAEHFSELR
jgi:aminoglycoside/choline kinase family phosphotransferase